jgi:electron transfer flavoprotein beta subunit
VLPALVDWLRARTPALVLAGARAEHGAATGLLPYALAKALGGVCIPDVTSIEQVADRTTVIQALPGGRRRRLGTLAPAVLTAAQAAPAPSGWAYARARRAEVAVEPAAMQPAPVVPWRTEPARPLARPVKKVRGGAAARMAAATSFTTGKGKLMVQPAAEEAARAILDYLDGEGLLRR